MLRILPRTKTATLLAATAATLATIGLGVASAAPAQASDPDPAVSIGAPMTGAWPNSDGCDGSVDTAYCSLPDAHHITYFNPDIDGGGAMDDFAMDLQGVGAGTAVVLHASAVDGGALTARVQQVNPSCASGDPADGGYAVSAAIYEGGVEVGTVTYAHLDPSVSAGDDIAADGTQLGTVGSYTAGSCWTGAHVHAELSSQHNYACYSGAYAPGQAINESDFMGHIGGSYASGQRAVCP